MSEQTRIPNPITNQKIWDMSKVIVDRIKQANASNFEEPIDWLLLEELYFDWIEEILFEGADVIQKPLSTDI